MINSQDFGFAVLVVCTTFLEIKGYPTKGLWTLVVILAIFGKF